MLLAESVEKWMKIPEATIWINSKRNGPPLEEHDLIRLLNAGRLAACFEYSGFLGIYEPGLLQFTDWERRHRSAAITHFKFSGILEILDGCDLREETEMTFSGQASSQGFRTFLVRIRDAWSAISEDLPEGKEIRPFGPHGATGTIKDVLIAYSDLLSCFPFLHTKPPLTAQEVQSTHATESTGSENPTPKKDGRITDKRESQIQSIERATNVFGYSDPLNLPTGARAKIKKHCIELTEFGHSDHAFKRAWAEANKLGRIRLAEKDKYMT